MKRKEIFSEPAELLGYDDTHLKPSTLEVQAERRRVQDILCYTASLKPDGEMRTYLRRTKRTARWLNWQGDLKPDNMSLIQGTHKLEGELTPTGFLLISIPRHEHTCEHTYKYTTHVHTHLHPRESTCSVSMKTWVCISITHAKLGTISTYL